jgi:hypothetical protein
MKDVSNESSRGPINSLMLQVRKFFHRDFFLCRSRPGWRRIRYLPLLFPFLVLSTCHRHLLDVGANASRNRL